MATKASITAVAVLSLMLIAIAVAGIKLLDRDALTFTGATTFYACVGTPYVVFNNDLVSDCSTLNDAGYCTALIGCEWDNVNFICSGTLTPCESFDEETCTSQGGCNWGVTCQDEDEDGYGALGYDISGCSASTSDWDCDDANKDKTVGTAEICDLEDNDCDGLIDEGVQTIFFKDSDGDGYGAAQTFACSAPEGYISVGNDCNDTDATVNPIAAEICDDKRDNNCNSQKDCAEFSCIGKQGSGGTCERPEQTCTDGFSNDGDTLIDCADQPDCFNKGTAEVCDGKDNNCNRAVDDGFGITSCGVGACQVTVYNCVNGAQTTCIPKEPTAEICDLEDNDCDGTRDEDFDLDKDSFYNKTTCPSYINPALLDQDDNDASVYAGAPELCDQKDNDGDGIIDNANGGTSIAETKCQCYNGGQPNETEELNGIDDTCDNALAPDEQDADGDGFAIYQGDCNDADGSVKPGATEICIDGKDNNCNGQTDSLAEGCGQQSGGGGGGGRHSIIKQATSTPVLGNGICEAGETSENAAIDCGCPTGEILVGTECKQEATVKTEAETAVCGNNAREGDEFCDRSDDSACIGACQSDCSCAWLPNNGVCEKAAGETKDNSPADCGFKSSGLLVLLTTFFGIFSMGFGSWYFKTRIKEGLSILARAYNAHIPSEDVGKVKKYAAAALKEGYAPEQIKSNLRGVGWPEDTIDKALPVG